MTAEEHSESENTARLGDEIEQLRTSLEAAQDEIGALAAERDRLRISMARLSRDLELAWQARSSAEANAASLSDQSQIQNERSSQAEEELRAAFEELQVLTEELEVSNATLRESNQHLDERVVERTAEIVSANIKLAESEARFRTLVEGMPQLIWRSERGGSWTWCSPQWSDFTGLSLMRSLGQGWLDAFHPDDRADAQKAWTDADRLRSLHFDARIYNAGEGRFRYFVTRAMPVYGDSGDVLEWLGTSTDVHDITELRERQGVLLAELQHRTRNLMGVVQSIVTRTLRGSSDLDDFGRRLEPRMAALSRVQGVLSRRGEGERINVDTLVREELAAHVDLDGEGLENRVHISGPGVKLRSATVQIFALGLHELATNALKYGALSQRGGTLSITWDVRETEAGSRLHVVWEEAGLAALDPSSPPARKGYGRELIERALPYQLGARTTYNLASEGVVCEIDAPLDDAA